VSGVVGSTRWGRDAVARVAIALAIALALVGAAPAAAQDGPYGSTSTTRGPGTQPSCQLRTRAAAPGETVTVHLRAISRGDQVEVRLDGEVVAQATAPSSGSAPRVNFNIDFVVPSDTEPGQHAVTAVGAGFTASCRTANGDDLQVAGSEVLSSGVERGGGGGSLPRTGMYIALLVALALVLLVVGRAVLTESRRRARSVTLDVHGPTPRTPRR
jgi:hypothetical protein